MKRIISAFLLFSVVFTLASCGAKRENNKEIKIENGTVSQEVLETYVGDGLMTIYSTLVKQNLEIVQNIAVYGHLETDANGVVADKSINTYAQLLALFRSAYGEKTAEKLIASCGYKEEGGKLVYNGGERKDAGVKYDPATAEIEIVSKSESECEFKVKVAFTSAKGKADTAEFRCTAVNSGSGWVLSDMYY